MRLASAFGSGQDFCSIFFFLEKGRETRQQSKSLKNEETRPNEKFGQKMGRVFKGRSSSKTQRFEVQKFEQCLGTDQINLAWRPGLADNAEYLTGIV